MRRAALIHCMVIVALLSGGGYLAHAQGTALVEAADASTFEEAAAADESNATRVFLILGILLFLLGLFSGHDWSLFALRRAVFRSSMRRRLF